MKHTPTLTLLATSLLVAFNASAQTNTPLTLKRVSLSSSGVGYFEYEAQVRGRATLNLPVGLDKVDDVLKSLVVYDTQGSIGGVSLPGLDPIAQTLKQLPFDPAALNNPAQLLEALRGADISVGGKQTMRGRIVSVLPIAATNTAPQTHQVMLMTAQGMQQFVVETAQNLRFEDPALRDQINKALTALSNNRAKDARSIDIISESKPNDNSLRTVRVGYVSTVPIWKNAYRFTLPNAALKQDAKAQVQGWAVIENMSGQDWTNVQLTLTAGKPIAFSQQLYRSYYNSRPQVGIELPGNVVPVADTGTYKTASESNILKPNDMARTADNMFSKVAASPARTVMPAPSPAAPRPMVNASASGYVAENASNTRPNPPLTAVAQANDIAAVQDNSTQTSYTFGLPVTVGSGRSLSIPIIQNDLPMQRVALYQPTVHQQHPLAAIELANTSANGMPAGAATLYEASDTGNQFIGDAQLSVLPASDKRYVSYALDQKINIDQRTDSSNTLKSYSLQGAQLSSDYAYASTAVFTVKSSHTEPRNVVVEVPIQGTDWALLDNPAHSAIGNTANSYRRNIVAAPQTTTSVAIRQERSAKNLQHLNSFDVHTLRNIAKDARLAQQAKPVLEAVIRLMDTQNEHAQDLANLESQLEETRQNQSRIRDNLKAVPVKSEPHTRYMKELNTADALDAKLQTQLAQASQKKHLADKALKDYLAAL